MIVTSEHSINDNRKISKIKIFHEALQINMLIVVWAKYNAMLQPPTE